MDLIILLSRRTSRVEPGTPLNRNKPTRWKQRQGCAHCAHPCLCARCVRPGAFQRGRAAPPSRQSGAAVPHVRMLAKRPVHALHVLARWQAGTSGVFGGVVGRGEQGRGSGDLPGWSPQRQGPASRGPWLVPGTRLCACSESPPPAEGLRRRGEYVGPEAKQQINAVVPGPRCTPISHRSDCWRRDFVRQLLGAGAEPRIAGRKSIHCRSAFCPEPHI